MKKDYVTAVDVDIATLMIQVNMIMKIIIYVIPVMEQDVLNVRNKYAKLL